MSNKDNLKKQISKSLATAGISHADIHLEQIISITNGYKDRGYKTSYGAVTDFICSDENRDILEDTGLDKLLQAMPNIKLGTITGGNKVGRNELCPCGSEKKYKKCCLNEK